MRNRLPWAVLLAATALSGGCATLCSTPNAIPVRRLPDELLHACPGPCQAGCEAIVKANKPAVKPVSAEVPVVLEGVAAGPACESSGCGVCGVFYTGGSLGSGQHPLTPGLRVAEAIAVTRGPIPPKCLAPCRVTVLRRLGSCQQIAIRVNLNEALRDPRENIPVWPNDMILTSGGCCDAACRALQQLFCCGLR